MSRAERRRKRGGKETREDGNAVSSPLGEPEKLVPSQGHGRLSENKVVPSQGPKVELIPSGDTEAASRLSAPSDLEKSVQDLAKLVMKLTKGLEEGVIPRIESLEKAMLELPEQLKGSFTKQSELLKGYVDQKLGIQASEALAHPAGSTTSTTRPKSLFQEAFDWVRAEVDKSGGLSKVLGGTGTGTTAELDVEIAQLQRIKMGQDKIGYRNWLKESVAKGPALPPGAPPTVEHV